MKKNLLILTALFGTVAFVTINWNPQKSVLQTPSALPAAEIKPIPYVLKSTEGEKLADPRGGIIKVSPQSGSKNLSMVVQPLPNGKKIGVHLHEHDEEVFFVHKGKGTVTLNDQRSSVEEGSVVFIPPGTWHSFEANDDMQLVWLISPPHFVDLYRLFFKPGFEPTKEQEEQLKIKYGYKEKPKK